MPTEWPLISVVFITFNRSNTLAVTVDSFLQGVDYPRDRLELIIADDGSDEHHRAVFDRLAVDRIVVGGPRSGMGANCNRGQNAASASLILLLQDDWRFVGKMSCLKEAVIALDRHQDVGFILLNSSPSQLPVRAAAADMHPSLRVFDNRPAVTLASVSEGAYSDWPHLKRVEAITAIGPYLESRKMWETELDYSQRVNAQTNWFVADFGGGSNFDHIGEDQSFNWPWKKRAHRMIVAVPGGNALWTAYWRIRQRLRRR